METSDLIAVIALFISISTFIWNEWKDVRKTRKKLKVQLSEKLSIDESTFTEDEINEMENAGVPSNEIPPHWDFRYKGEIKIKNIGKSSIFIDSIYLKMNLSGIKFEINQLNLENSILLEKGKSHITYFYFNPDRKDIERLIKAKSCVEVLDLDGKKYKSNWVKLTFPETLE